MNDCIFKHGLGLDLNLLASCWVKTYTCVAFGEVKLVATLIG